jgi:hypothetical protein
MTPHKYLLLALAFSLVPLLPGCPEETEEVSGDLVLIDANNYSFDGLMNISSYPAAELTDVLIDWSAVDTDLQTHPMDPETDVNTMSLVVFTYLTHEEVEIGLSQNTLQQADVGLYLFTDVTGQTSESMSECTLFGTDVDVETYFELDYGQSWLITLSKGSTPGVGTLMAAFLDPTPGEENTEVILDNESTTLTVDVDIMSATALPAPADTALTIDWTGLTIDGQGNEMKMGDIDQVMVGYYASLTPTDLEDNLLDLEYVHDGMWYLDLTAGGTTAELSTLTDDDGNAFTGITAEGTWILALRCTTCPNPAPPFLTVFEVPAS